MTNPSFIRFRRNASISGMTFVLMLILMIVSSPAWTQNSRSSEPEIPNAILIMDGGDDRVSTIEFGPNDHQAISNDGNDLVLWNLDSGERMRTLKGHQGEINPVGISEGLVNDIAISPDGIWAVSASRDMTLKLWNISDGEEVRAFIGHSAEVASVAFSPDGRYILSGSGDRTLKLWDVQTGDMIRTFIGHEGCVSCVAYSPDGRYGLSGGEDNNIILWDISSGREIRRLNGHANIVFAVAFSPDGNLALSGSSDNTMALWNVNNGEEIRTFTGLDFVLVFRGIFFGAVTCVAFTPDGQYAISSSWDSTLKLWDLNSGEEVRTFSGHAGQILNFDISSDGEYAILASPDDGKIILWDLGL